ncbi:MAG: cytochrome c, partial [bacterium]|nr:cytochrome c [bacterium]
MRKGIAPPRKNPKITGCKYPYSITPFLISCVVLFILSSSAIAEEAYEYFRDNCYSCHTIGGGRLTGPDLKDLEERRDREWSLNFIQNPKAVVDSGDPYAQEIFDDAGGVLMPAPARMTHELGESLLDLIAAESKLEE